jgi:helix-turn-helix protein
MSSVVFLTTESKMSSFMNAVTALRRDYRKLSKTESNALIAFYNEVKPKDLADALDISKTAAESIFNRLKSLNYAEEGGHLSSYGISAAEELLSSQK